MSNLSPVPAGPEATGSDGRSSFHQHPHRQQPAADSQQDAATPPDCGHRLVIQEDKATGQYLYMVIDRATGAVVAQTPREDVARMSQRADYTAGSLIRAKA
jgi:hypothetical protein